MDDRLSLSQGLFDEILAHCRSEYPNEACGLIAGKGETAEKVYAIKNIEPSPVSYLMDPAGQFRAMKEMGSNGGRILAIFHSHPASPAYPSAKDIELAFYEDSFYVIIGLSDFEHPEAGVFKIRAGEVLEFGLDLSRT